MSDLDNWKSFCATGKVEDYLRYAASTAEKDEREGREADKNAGVAHRDRTHTESGTYRGI